MKHTKIRPAIAMVELIFSIVVMGIALMSAPMLMSTASQSGFAATQQEGINEAASQVNVILGYAWDEVNTDDSHVPVILQTNGDVELNEVGVTGRRAGTDAGSARTFIDDQATKWNASTVGADGGDRDDMDDFNAVTNLTQIEASTTDYIEKAANISITSTVGYIGDASTYSTSSMTFTPNFTPLGGGTTSNIKNISVVLTSESNVDELDKTITLHAFSSNIGVYALEER